MSTVNQRADLLPTIVEVAADEAILTGNMVELTATGVKNGSTAEGGYAAAFAVENVAGGQGSGYEYSSGETVPVAFFPSGAPILANIGASQTIVKGDTLTSAGDGTLKKAGTVVIGAPTFTALAAVTTGVGASATLNVIRN